MNFDQATLARYLVIGVASSGTAIVLTTVHAAAGVLGGAAVLAILESGWPSPAQRAAEQRVVDAEQRVVDLEATIARMNSPQGRRLEMQEQDRMRRMAERY